jgi:hypothetical protein
VVAAAVSGALTLVALPFVLGFGADPLNPSFLPREYGRNLLLLVVAVWLVAAVWAVVAVRRPRRLPPGLSPKKPRTDGPRSSPPGLEPEQDSDGRAAQQPPGA